MFDENKIDFDEDETADDFDGHEDVEDIEDDLDDREEEMDESAYAAENNESANSDQIMKNVLLNLSCEIAKVNLSLGEILQLKIGSTINIPEFPPLVRLKLNDQYIAEGMLVQINGRVGVKIIRK